MNLREIIEEVSRIVLKVYETLGSGHAESVYENAVKVGLRLANIFYEDQRAVPLTYEGFYVGYGCPDIIVRYDGGEIILELKAVASKIGGKEIAQLKAYMRSLNIKNGLLINMQAPGSDLEKETIADIREISI